MRSIFLISRALNARKRKIFALFFALAASVGISWAQQLEPVAPEGALDGAFTVNANGDQIAFAQGNLQHQASTNTWRFAANQYDLIGSDNSNISDSYTGWIDLFGWGTGSNPTLSSTDDIDYSTFTDWGVNAISNGGNTADTWRTLTKDEWVYLLNTRTTTSGVRYAKATITDVTYPGTSTPVVGLIIVPNNWQTSYHALTDANTANAAFNTNQITSAVWASDFESAGAVFLPAAGYRYGTDVYYVGSYGRYWSATPFATMGSAFRLFFNSDYLDPQNGNGRGNGQSVRLVTKAMDKPIDPKTTVSFVDSLGNPLASEQVEFNLPEAPEVEGFTFVRWDVLSGALKDGFKLQAVYTENATTLNAPKQVKVGKFTLVRKDETNEYILETDK